MSYYGLPFQIGHDLAKSITQVRRYFPGDFCPELKGIVPLPRPGFTGCLAVEQTRAIVERAPTFASQEKILSTQCTWEF